MSTHNNKMTPDLVTFVAIKIVEMILHEKKYFIFLLISIMFKTSIMDSNYVEHSSSNSPECSLTSKSNNCFYFIEMVSVTLSGSKCYFEGDRFSGRNFRY